MRMFGLLLVPSGWNLLVCGVMCRSVEPDWNRLALEVCCFYGCVGDVYHTNPNIHEVETYCDGYMSDIVGALTGLLDFYSDKANAQASFLVADIFGLFTLLAIVEVMDNHTLQFFSIVTYAVLLMVGYHCLVRYGYWTQLADAIQFRVDDYALSTVLPTWVWEKGRWKPITLGEYIEKHKTAGLREYVRMLVNILYKKRTDKEREEIAYNARKRIIRLVGILAFFVPALLVYIDVLGWEILLFIYAMDLVVLLGLIVVFLGCLSLVMMRWREVKDEQRR